jgi:hypothetical protein
LWAEWLQKEVLASVPHRHVVVTMPCLLRGIFREWREILLDISQCAAQSLTEYMKRQVGANTRPGTVVSIATSGDLLQWHPHGHLLVTDGGFSDNGAFHPLETCDADAVMKLFRERVDPDGSHAALNDPDGVPSPRIIRRRRDRAGRHGRLPKSPSRVVIDPASAASIPAVAIECPWPSW